ncbi:MAG: hypothetical protein KF838_08210 [Phycisphaeraceae bacterium]|nr:MAG: hypothetical protein KF838_08210 [Phycisphaeraceae bacterium]
MKRAIALLSVLLVIVLGALTAMIALDQSDATASGARGSLLRREARAAAWSGVLGVMAELETQRNDLIEGGDPELTEEWTIYTDGSTTARVRLEQIGSDGGSPPSALARSEAAKLNLNVATAPMLARLSGLGDERAQSIRSLATRGGLTSIEDLRLVGIDPRDEAGAIGGVSLESLATAYSLDPDLGIGVGDRASSGRKRARWDAAAGSFDRRLAADNAVTETVERLTGANVDLSSAQDVARALDRLSISPSVWAALWDELAFGEQGAGREGLVDISRAPEAVLGCIPGFEGRAKEIHEAARRLGADRTRSPTWPLDARLVSSSDMARALPWITTRTLHWRVRIVGEITRASSSNDEPIVLSRAALDAIIDCSADRVRVSYLRDVTFDGASEGIDTLLAQTLVADEEQSSTPPESSLGASLAEAAQPGDDARSVSRPSGTRNGTSRGVSPSPQQGGDSSGQRRGRWSAKG